MTTPAAVPMREMTKKEAAAVLGKEWCDKHDCLKLPESDSAAIWFDFPDYCPKCRYEQNILKREAERILSK